MRLHSIRAVSASVLPLVIVRLGEAAYQKMSPPISFALLDRPRRVNAIRVISVLACAGSILCGQFAGASQVNNEDEVRLIPQVGNTEQVVSIATSVDDRWVLTADSGGEVVLWEASTGTQLRALSRGTVVAVSPDGVHCAIAGDRRTEIWDLSKNILTHVLTNVTRRGKLQIIPSTKAAVFSPDGGRLITESSDATLVVWDVRTGSRLRTMHDNATRVGNLVATDLGVNFRLMRQVLAVFPDGKHCLYAGLDGTAAIWDLAKGCVVRRLAAASPIFGVAVSRDGKHVVLGGGQIEKFTMTPGRLYRPAASMLELWNPASGKRERTYPSGGEVVTSVAFSPNGKEVFAGYWDGTASCWDIDTGVELRRYGTAQPLWLTQLRGPPPGLALSADGTFLVLGQFRTATLSNVVTGMTERILAGKVSPVNALSTSQESASFLAGNGNVTLWSDGSPHAELRGTGVVSPDGQFAATMARDDTIRIWNAHGALITKFGTGAPAGVSNRLSAGAHPPLCLSANAKRLLVGTPDGRCRLWNIDGELELVALYRHREPIKNVALSADTHLVATAGDSTVSLWDAETGTELRTLHTQGLDYPPWPGTSVFATMSFSPDGSELLFGDWAGGLRLWSVADWKEGAAFGELQLLGPPDPSTETQRVGSFPGAHAGQVCAAMFSPDGREVVSGGMDGIVSAWDVATAKQKWTVDVDSHVHAVAYLANGRFIAAALEEGSIRILDAAGGREMVRLLSFQDGTWAVVDPDGRYDSAAAGDIDGLSWVVENEPIALYQLKERYFEPGLLARVLGYSKEPLRDVRAFKNVALYPLVAVTPPPTGSTKATITLTDRGGGIGKVRVLVNGKEVVADARGQTVISPTQHTASLQLDLADAPFIAGEPNRVEVLASNAEGYLSSRGVAVQWTPPDDGQSKTVPELYVIVGGISEYASPALRLRYAAKDASDVARALQLGAMRLFGASKVHLTLLSSSSGEGATPPTKANFATVFAAARQARPADVLVVYLAGHGVALPAAAGEYAYLTQEARSADLTDPAVRQQNAVTSEELTSWVKAIPALKQVLILDTCAAGAAADKLVEPRSVSSGQIRAIERLKDRTGFHVLMGSAADAASYEATQYGQGLLTYALLEGLRGAALRDGEFADVSRLFQYATDRVPSLAKNIGGIQRPIISAPNGASFDIGQFTSTDKAQIPLAQEKPMILRPSFLDGREGFDSLDLSSAVLQLLREQSYTIARGQSAGRIVCLDADDLPGAIRASGTYTINRTIVRVLLILTRDKRRIAATSIEGRIDDPLALAARLVAEIVSQSER